jgi:hypothetical protein
MNNETNNNKTTKTVNINVPSALKTKEERMSAFVGCLRIASCEGELTEKDLGQLDRICSYIGLAVDEVEQCLGQPETVEFVVPDSKAACLDTVMCLISMIIENGKINSVEQAKMLHAACQSYGVSDDECGSLIDQLAQEERNQVA